MAIESASMEQENFPAAQSPVPRSWPHTSLDTATIPSEAQPATATQPEPLAQLEKRLAHTLVLDSGPIIKNTPTVSYLLANSHRLVTIPEVIAELRDEATRTRIETQLLPFLELRSPKPESVKAVVDFSRRTGDLSVLSRPDVRVLALAYEIEVERNGGDWRLRSTPGQKSLNGKPPGKKHESIENDSESKTPKDKPQPEEVADPTHELTEVLAKTEISVQEQPISSDTIAETGDVQASTTAGAECMASVDEADALQETIESDLLDERLGDETPDLDQDEAKDDDDEGWITHTNIKQHQAKDTPALVASTPLERTMQCATLTTDFAMQNVLLQMNLNLLSSQLQRIRHLKTFILRCHACFFQCKDTSKQFCPRCGKPALTRVSCSTNSNGEFQIHLKKNMQWNNRGNRYSLPKPVTGSASGRVLQGGGTGGWGQDLILAEDQKEYMAKMNRHKKAKEKDLMNEDFLPDILTGGRHRDVGGPKVGAGRNVNAKRRKK